MHSAAAQIDSYKNRRHQIILLKGWKAFELLRFMVNAPKCNKIHYKNREDVKIKAAFQH